MIKDYLLLFRMNLKIILEYKTSFIIQAVTMLISNTSFFVIWYFIFKRFGTFGWFTYRDYLILFTALLLNFCFVHIIFGWYRNISKWISNWQLDNYLLMPRSVLFKILISSIPNSIFWDLINAFLIPLFLPGFTFLLFIKIFYLAFIWSIVFTWFIVFAESLSFYIWSSKELSRAMFELLLWPSNYPEKIYEWTFFKYLFASVVPVYYAFYLPFNLAMHFDWKWFLILHLTAIIFFSLWYFSFYNWLKLYESWNLLKSNIN